MLYKIKDLKLKPLQTITKMWGKKNNKLGIRIKVKVYFTKEFYFLLEKMPSDY